MTAKKRNTSLKLAQQIIRMQAKEIKELKKIINQKKDNKNVFKLWGGISETEFENLKKSYPSQAHKNIEHFFKVELPRIAVLLENKNKAS